MSSTNSVNTFNAPASNAEDNQGHPQQQAVAPAAAAPEDDYSLEEREIREDDESLEEGEIPGDNESLEEGEIQEGNENDDSLEEGESELIIFSFPFFSPPLGRVPDMAHQYHHPLHAPFLAILPSLNGMVECMSTAEPVPVHCSHPEMHPVLISPFGKPGL